MALLSKREFAASTGQNTKTLATYIGRKKVIVNKKGQIDTNNEVNKTFIAMKAWRKMDKSMPADAAAAIENESPAINLPKIRSKKTDSDEDYELIPDIITSEKRYKHALAQKTEAQHELDLLKIEKLKGDVIPSGPIEQIVYQRQKYWVDHAKIAFEKALMEISHKYELTSEDMAYYRGQNTKLINDAVLSSAMEFSNNLTNIISEFTVKKGVL